MNRFVKLLQKYAMSLLQIFGIVEIVIDIGLERISGYVILRFPTLKILKYSSEPLDLSRLSFYFERFIERFLSFHPMYVSLSISGLPAIFRLLTLPPLPKKRLETTILWEIRKSVPVEKHLLVWNYRVVGKVKKENIEQLKILVGMIKSEIIEELIKITKNLNIEVKTIVHPIPAILDLFNAGIYVGSVAYIVKIIEGQIIVAIKQKDALIKLDIFDDIDPNINLKYITNSLASFIKEPGNFLERIIILSNSLEFELMEKLMDTLNILTVMVAQEDFKRPINLENAKEEIFLNSLIYSLTSKSTYQIELLTPKYKKAFSYVVSLVRSFIIMTIVSVSLIPFVVPMITDLKSYLYIREIENFLERKTGKISLDSTYLQILELKSLKRNILKLEDQLALVESLLKSARRSYWNVIIYDIAMATPNEIYFTNMEIKSRTVRIEGVAYSSSALFTFISNLKNLEYINEINITSSERKTQKIFFTLEIRM